MGRDRMLGEFVFYDCKNDFGKEYLHEKTCNCNLAQQGDSTIIYNPLIVFCFAF